MPFFPTSISDVHAARFVLSRMDLPPMTVWCSILILSCHTAQLSGDVNSMSPTEQPKASLYVPGYHSLAYYTLHSPLSQWTNATEGRLSPGVDVIAIEAGIFEFNATYNNVLNNTSVTVTPDYGFFSIAKGGHAIINSEVGSSCRWKLPSRQKAINLIFILC